MCYLLQETACYSSLLSYFNICVAFLLEAVLVLVHTTTSPNEEIKSLEVFGSSCVPLSQAVLLHPVPQLWQYTFGFKETVIEELTKSSQFAGVANGLSERLLDL
ncbi:hypothetical protein B0H34DRAFT_679818 [Crassisporium funariophilum]|nr:hypothetical protein B0H34DRAFT_679818 [Crassisporium funariophilum]